MEKQPKKRGRKPKSAEDKQSITLTFRVTKELHHVLEMEAKRRRIPIGTFIKSRLKGLTDGERERKFASKTANALAYMVRHLTMTAEISTGKKWCEDRYTCTAVTVAIGQILQHFTPAGKVIIPPAPWGKDKKFPKKLSSLLKPTRTPEGLASMIAGGFLQNLLTADYPQSNKSYSTEENYDFFHIREILGKKGK